MKKKIYYNFLFSILIYKYSTNKNLRLEDLQLVEYHHDNPDYSDLLDLKIGIVPSSLRTKLIEDQKYKL